MKWGVRRDRGSDGTVGGAHGESTSADAAKAKDYAKKAQKHGTEVLANHELQHLVNRMNLEQQYSRLTTTPSAHDRVKKGQDYARTLLGVAKIGQESYKLATGPEAEALSKLLKKK